MTRIAIIVFSSLLLVGLVAAVTVGFVTNWGKPDVQKLAASSKAVQAICQPTDYKDACVKSLANVNTDDPKELVKAAFTSAKNELSVILEKSATIKELEKDPKSAEAIKDCKELFQDAIDDFQRSLDEVGRFEWDQVNKILENLKIWLSATRTYQETCLDGFENTTGDASMKIRKVLQTSIQMSSNGLAIVNDLSSLLGNLDIGGFIGRRLLSHHRRLLGDDDNNGVLLQDNEEDQRRRRLLSSLDQIVGHTNGEFLPEWIDGIRRKLLTTPNLAEDLKAKANVVVAQDGSGKYKTIEEALKDIPKNGQESYIIYIKEGVYNEYLVLYKYMTNVVFVGDGPTKTRITNNKNFADGTKTFKTATLSVLGDFFMAKDIGVENSAGAIKHQAVAFRAQSDKAIFFNCHFDGYQDTLYAHTYRQFYRDCRITGTIDFIFGDAAAFFQNCTFVVRKPLENQNCIVTAQGRMERHQPTGIIIHKSKFEADPDYEPVKTKNKAYLGRPWKEYSKTIIMESQIDDLIQPDGWLPWEGNFGLETCYYGEYNNAGAGSSLTNRVKWRGVKTIVHERAEKFMPPTFFENDDWIKASGIPYDPSLSGVASGPISGYDEDPNAPAGAPAASKFVSSGGSSSAGGSTSKGSSGGSSSSDSTSKEGGSNGSSSSGGSSSSSGSSSSGGSSSSTPSGGSSNGGSSSSSGGSSSSSGGASSGGSSSSSGGASSSSSSSTQTPPSNGGGTTPSAGGASGSSASTTTPSEAPSPMAVPIEAPTPTPTPSEAPAPSKDELSTPSPTPTTSPTSSATTQGTSPTSSPNTAKATSPTSSSSAAKATSPTSAGTKSPTTPGASLEINLGGGSSSSGSGSGAGSGEGEGEGEGKGEGKNSGESENGSSNQSPPAEGAAKLHDSVSMRELERILMQNEEMEEDEDINDDMSGNVPDGDEPSPARVTPTPAPAPSHIAESPAEGPSEEVSDWLPPAAAPEAEEEADKVPPTVSPPPKPNHGSKTFKFELHVILSVMVMWAALFM